MTIRELSLRLPPNGAIGLARALGDAPGLAVLAAGPRGGLHAEDVRSSFVACEPVESSDAVVPPEAPRERGWAGLPAAPRWIGVLPYEAFRGLERGSWCAPDERAPALVSRCAWFRYAAVARVDHFTGVVAIEADDDRAASALAERLAAARQGPPSGCDVVCHDPAAEDGPHGARVRAILERIAAGEVYQVNLARRLDGRLVGSPLELFARLARRTGAPYGFYLRTERFAVAGTSPELALEVRSGRARTAPIKGTRPRGPHAEADLALAAELDASEKERAELVMAIDLHRNDLGRVARPGSVRVLGEPRLVHGATVTSRVAEIACELDPTTTLESVVRAMLPCGSVTGAPKVRAMELLRALEPHRRGLYTGAMGYVGRDGSLVLAMAIRTAVVDLQASSRDGSPFSYFVGGGIVAGSDPSQEIEETYWKSMQLLTN
jgi:anthranilate/para-aminobenzoate synthase component I